MMFKILLIVLFNPHLTSGLSCPTEEVTFKPSDANVASDFLGVMIGSGKICSNFATFPLNVEDKLSTKFDNIAKALAPTVFRIGGSAADHLTFDPDADENPKNACKGDSKDFVMNADHLLGITSWASRVGFDLMFDFNFLKRETDVDSPWNPANAREILKFSEDKSIKFVAFQLGNEPNSYMRHENHSFEPSTLVEGTKSLRKLIDTFDTYKGLPIYGPDVTSLGRHKQSCKYYRDFIAAGGNKVVSAASWHHYYFEGKGATVDQFYNKTYLDAFKLDIKLATKFAANAVPPVPLRITETSNAFGGGAKGLSDRYVAGFLWLDKLGLCALGKVTAVVRQAYFRGSYALITNAETLEPNPDYWLSVLFKRLVLGPVMATVQTGGSKLRIYANCARKDVYGFPTGALVVYYVNIEDCEIKIKLKDFNAMTLKLFKLSAGDGGMTSHKVKLNGNVLAMAGDKLPELQPKDHKGEVVILAKSFGFIVVPDARVTTCGYKSKSDEASDSETSESGTLVVVLWAAFCSCSLAMVVYV